MLMNEIPKVVSGITEHCLERVCKLYEQVFDQMVAVSSTEAAELTKLLENTYRLVNISFINRFAQLCDTLHVNVWEVIQAAATKPYGFSPFYPGRELAGTAFRSIRYICNGKWSKRGHQADSLK